MSDFSDTDLIDDFDEQEKMLEMFVSGSLESLDEIENDLLTLEDQGEDFDDDLINKVFRAAHTIKGESGFINLVTIGKLAHSIEGILDKIRDHELIPERSLVSLLLESFDELRNLIQEIETSEEVDVSSYIERLKQFDPSYEATAEVAPLVPEKVEVVEAPIVESSQVVEKPKRVLPESPAESSPNAHVLVIDDDPSICKLVKFHLGKAGIECETVYSYDDAVSLMTKRLFHVVVLDIDLQTHSGFDLIKVLKGINPLSQIMMLSGNVNSMNVIDALEHGAFDFFSKGGDFKKLSATVKEALHRAIRWLPLMKQRAKLHA